MSALRDTTPGAQPGPGPSVGGRPPVRRPSSARPAVGAAGQARRTLQRDLARREASLRISRRVSGPAGGIQRPPFADPAAGLELAPPFDGPIGAQRLRPAAQPLSRSRQPAPDQRTQPRPGPARVTPQRAPSDVPGPLRTAPQPMATSAARRPLAGALSFGVTGSVNAGAAGAAVAMPRPQVAPAPTRRPLIALPGGALEAAPRRRQWLSTPTMIVMSLVLLVVTVGAIVALQIQVTQVNERMGNDLASITRYQQSTTALREQISRQVSGARIDGEVTRRGLLEPEVADVRYLKVGDAAATARRAAQALKAAPVVTAASAAAAEATAAQTAAAGTAPGSAGAAATTAPSVTTPTAPTAPTVTTP